MESVEMGLTLGAINIKLNVATKGPANHVAAQLCKSVNNNHRFSYTVISTALYK